MPATSLATPIKQWLLLSPPHLLAAFRGYGTNWHILNVNVVFRSNEPPNSLRTRTVLASALSHVITSETFYPIKKYVIQSTLYRFYEDQS